MKTATLIFLLILTHPGSAESKISEEKKVQLTIIGMFDGMASLDTIKIRSYCSDDVIILEKGSIWNFDSLATKVAARKAKVSGFKRINQIDFIKTTINGNTAWVYYNNQATVTSDDKTVIIKWLESAVLTRVNKEWKIKLLHSTETERIKQ